MQRTFDAMGVEMEKGERLGQTERTTGKDGAAAQGASAIQKHMVGLVEKRGTNHVEKGIGG
jgi:hypothetical protein